MTTIAQVLAVLERLTDPCSAATGRPMSIVAMGLVDEGAIIIDDDRVQIALLLTDPLCAFFRDLASWIETELGELGFRKVTVTTRSELWTPSRMRATPIRSMPHR